MLPAILRISIISFLLGLLLNQSAIAQVDSTDIRSERHNKALFSLTKFNISRYSMHIKPHNLALEVLTSNRSSFGGLGADIEVRRGSGADILLKAFRGSTLSPRVVEGDTIASVTMSILGVNVETRYGYHHVLYGAAAAYVNDGFTGVTPTFYLGYRFQNPTRRLVFKFGLNIMPSKKIETTWVQSGLGFAFGKVR